MSWIEAGTTRSDEYPADTLVPPELEELRRIVAAREELVQRVGLLEQQMTLFITVCRDRRGLVGRVRVNHEDGRIVPAEGSDG